MTQGSKDSGGHGGHGAPTGRDKEGFDRIKGRPAAPGSAAPSSPSAASTSVGDDDAAAMPAPGVEEQAAAIVEGDLATMLEKAQHERDEYLDMSRRVQADFENYKKRMLREQTSILERAGESLVTALLPVLDAFDLARAHLDVAESTPEGKALVQASALLADALAREGLERIDAVGVPFDPTVHEAVEHLPAEKDEDPDGEAGPIVTDVLRTGYRWKGRVIRPPMVRVRG